MVVIPPCLVVSLGTDENWSVQLAKYVKIASDLKLQFVELKTPTYMVVVAINANEE